VVAPDHRHGAAADRYCAGYGGFAQATKVDEHRVRFTCVASAEAPSES
jgi:hypothetical protein